MTKTKRYRRSISGTTKSLHDVVTLIFAIVMLMPCYVARLQKKNFLPLFPLCFFFFSFFRPNPFLSIFTLPTYSCQIKSFPPIAKTKACFTFFFVPFFFFFLKKKKTTISNYLPNLIHIPYILRHFLNLKTCQMSFT